MTIARSIGVRIHHAAAALGLLPQVQRIARRVLDRLTR